MELYRDLMFKRNLHGYVEETRVQLYKGYLRQIPLWVVYHPLNEEIDLRDVERYGHYFISGGSVVDYFDKFKAAWVSGEEYIPSIDLCHEVIEHIRHLKPGLGEKMYRLIYRCPDADIPECAMGHAPFDVDHPWFVSSRPDRDGIGRWCVYPESIALVLVKMLSASQFSGYVYDRTRNNPGNGEFVIQHTPYNVTGSPDEFDVWTDGESTPHWNIPVYLDFNEAVSKVVNCYYHKL